MKILICGLPGSGKTTYAKALVEPLKAVHFNADAVRANINRDLKFGVVDRLEQARRMGWLADRVKESGNFCVCDFICPTEETRLTFGADYTIWMDTIKKGCYNDTNLMWVEPAKYDLRVIEFLNQERLRLSVNSVVSRVKGKLWVWDNSTYGKLRG